MGERLSVWSPENWRCWPHLSISGDLGSDGLAATRFADPSNERARDNSAALNACGL